MSNEILAPLMLVCLLMGIFAGYRVAFVVGGVAVIFCYIGGGPTLFNVLPSRVMGIMGNYTLAAVPLFIFMGAMLQISGAAENLYESIYLWLGPLRGGLAITTVIISTLLAAATGIIGATETTMGMVALPAMIKKNYNKPLATGTILVGGTLGILIPPSIMLIILAPTTGVSVISLFAGAIIPGLLLSSLYIIYIILLCLIRPEMGPALSKEDRSIPIKVLLFKTLVHLIPPIVLILLVLGTIFFGVAAPTEAAAVGAVGSVLVAAVNRRINWQVLKQSIFQTLRVTSMVLMIAVGASLFSAVFASIGGSKAILSALNYLPESNWITLFAMMFLVLIMGMFLDWFAIILIVMPILMIVSNKIGFDPLWFSIIICVNLQIAFLTPPFAYAIFYLKGVAPPEVTIYDIYKGIVPFIGLQIIGLILCILFPQLVLWLPSIMAK